MEAASREQLGPQPQQSGDPRAATSVAASGLVLGAVAGVALSAVPLVNAGWVNIGLAGLGLIGSGAILVLQGAGVTLRSFGARNLALWGGYAAGGLVAVAILGGSPILELSWIYLLSAAVKNSVATSILGSAAVLAIRRALPKPHIDSRGDSRRRFIQKTAALLMRVRGAVRRRRSPNLRFSLT